MSFKNLQDLFAKYKRPDTTERKGGEHIENVFQFLAG